jgi:hypothetical protein
MMESCVEPFDFETISFDDALVIEATITNEFKRHEISLTRTFKFEEDAPSGESNANVIITDDLLNSYTFEETTPGKYVSITEFSAEPNRIYKLSITTGDESTYSSQPVQLPQVTQVDDLMAIREANIDGVDGVTIYANSFDPTGNSRYYRYEFEETYLILAPFAISPEEVIVLSDNPPYSIETSVTTQPRSREERACFNTVFSNAITQTQTTGLQEDRVSRFPIHFIKSNDPIIRDRYSINVKQYVQSLEAFTYYKVLNELSGSESILSQNQPGFISGNITSNENPDEKVLGFFEISSVSSKRLFFNFFDIFPDINRPFYFTECVLDSPRLVDEDDPTISPLINQIQSNSIRHVETNTDFFGNIDPDTPYTMINRPCGDCTVFGTNIKPGFWID